MPQQFNGTPALTNTERAGQSRCGYTKDKNGNLILIGTMPVPFSKDKSSPATRRKKKTLGQTRCNDL
jgi:hypothetical protein